MATINGIIRIATDTKERWESKNPKLLKGELTNSTYTISRTYNNVPYTYNTNDIKIGDNSAHYNDLKILNPIKTATGNCSIVSIASDNNQISDDIQNIANGENSIALGRKLTVLGNNSASIGNANFVGRNSSIAIGDNINIPAGSVRVIVVGRFNDANDMADAVFVVGTGDASNNTKNGLIVKSTGEVKVKTLNASDSITATNVITTNISIKGYPNTDNSIKLLGGYKSANDETPKLAIQSTGAKGTIKYVVTSDTDNSDINSIVSVAVNNWAKSAGEMTNPMTMDLDMGNNIIKNIKNLVFNNTSVIAINNLAINQYGIGKTYTKNGISNTAKIIFNDERIIIDGNYHDPGDQEIRLANPLLANNFLFNEITLDDIEYDEYITKNIAEGLIDEKTKYYNVVNSNTPILTIDDFSTIKILLEYDNGKYKTEEEYTYRPVWSNKWLLAANRKIKIPGNNSYADISISIPENVVINQNIYVIINGTKTNITNVIYPSAFEFHERLYSDVEIIFENIGINDASAVQINKFTEMPVDSITIGENLNTSSGQFVMGRYNANDPNNIFEIGNGTDNEHRSNAFYVDKNGNTSIEVPDSSHLDVKGSVNFNTGTVTLNGANIKYPSIHSIPNNPSNTQLVPFKTVKDYVDTYHGNGTVIGSAGFVYGTNSSVGGKGMPIVDYNGTIGEEGTYTLSNVTQEFADRIAIGDIVSIVMKGNFDCWSKVTSVVYEAANEIIKLTVDTFFTNEKDVSTGDTTSYDAHKTYSSSGKLTYAPEMGFAIQNPSEKQVYIYIVGKPDVGSVLLADGGASFGEDVIVQGKDSFGSGYNIWVGKYAAAIGKNVKAAYGDFAAGRDIDLSEAQVSSAIGNNLKIGGFASGTTLFGQYLESNRSNQTVVGTYNNFRYNDVFEIGAGNTSGRKNAFAVDQYGLIWSNEGLIADQLLTETLSTSKMVMADNMVTGSIVTKTSDVTADTQACIPLYNSTHTQGNGSVYMYVDGSKLGCQDGKYYVVGLTMFMNNLVATDKKPVFFGRAKGTSMNASVRADGSFKESPVQIGNNDLRVVFKYDSTAPIMCIYLDAYGRTNNVYWDLSTSDLFVYQLNPISSWFKSKDSFSSGYVPVYEHATGHSVNECIFNNTDGLGIYDVGGLPYLATTEASTIRLDLYTANAKSYKEKQLEARIAALEAKIS